MSDDLNPPRPVLAAPEGSSPSSAHRLLDDSINFEPAVLALRRYRYAIAAATISGALAGWGVSIATTPLYEATARSFVGEQLGADVSAEALQRYRGVIVDPEIPLRLARDLGVEGDPAAINAIRDGLDAFVTPQSNVIVVRVRLSAPDLAEKAALAAIGHLSDRALEVDTTLTKELYERRNKELADAELVLSRARAELAPFVVLRPEEEFRPDVEQIRAFRNEVVSLSVQIAAESARLDTAEAVLAQTPRVNTIKRSLDSSDPALAELLRQFRSPTPTVLAIDAELPNPHYNWLAQEVSALRLAIAGARARRASLTRIIRSPTAMINATGEVDTRVPQLRADVSRAQTARNEIADAVERILRNSSNPRRMVRAVDEQQRRARLLRPRAGRLIAVGAVTGLLAMVGIAWLLQSVGGSERAA